MFPSHGLPYYVWLRRPSRLKMNSLRSALTAASPAKRKTHPCEGNIRYELTQLQNALTATGLLMEGQCALPACSCPI
jgi:hypothetical protein